MIRIYCNKKHSSGGNLCESCKELIEYSDTRVENCPHMETKSFCSKCSTHCYDELHRDKIRQVMRFSGPRAIIYHPITTIKHMIPFKLLLRKIKFLFPSFHKKDYKS